MDEACVSMGWRVYAWCLMGNHYHLCIETPHPNLVEGMRWLQSTFANRFNRFRKSNGHVFQGRYKAILLDGDALGAVCHYIHLNPVRAGLVDASALQTYTESSFAQLWYPSRRRVFESPEVALEFAGGLTDSPSGRRKYRDYLGWLTETDVEAKRLGFEKMSHGWVKGSKDFKRSVLEDLKDGQMLRVVESEASEMREPLWERALARGLLALDRDAAALSADLKGAGWKVDLARHLRENHLTPYRWIASNLHMGAPSYVQSLVSRQRKQQASKEWVILQKHGKLD
jgi:REP element-mobilizing transposase RayT